MTRWSEPAEGRVQKRTFRPSEYGDGELQGLVDGQACGFFVWQMASSEVTEDVKKLAAAELIYRQQRRPQEEDEVVPGD